MFKKLPKGNASEIYIRLKDGEEVIGCFVGTPIEYYQVFMQPEKFQKWGEGRQYKFEINFCIIDQKTNEKKIKIMSNGKRFAKAIQEMMEEYGMNFLFKIKRTGSKKEDTNYMIMPKVALTPAQLEEIKELPLIPLSSKFEDDDRSESISAIDVSSIPNFDELGDKDIPF